MISRHALAISALVCVAGCASTPPSSTPPSSTTAASTTASAEPAASAPGATAPSAASSAEAAAAAPATAAAEDSGGDPDPAPLTEEEQKEAEKKCKPLMVAMQKAKGSGQNALDALTTALKKPPPQLKSADLGRCSDLLTRGIQAYVIAMKEVEAKVVMKQIALGMTAAYEDSHGTLCPSSEHPVPADKALVAKAPYVSTEADWSTPAWKCLRLNLTGQTQRFQYEVKVDAAQKTFEIIARGVPGTRWIEMRQKGTASSTAIKMDPVERKSVGR